VQLGEIDRKIPIYFYQHRDFPLNFRYWKMDVKKKNIKRFRPRIEASAIIPPLSDLAILSPSRK
jgi:hypothetical protein